MAKPLTQSSPSCFRARKNSRKVSRRIYVTAPANIAKPLESYDPLVWREAFSRMSFDELDTKELSLLIDILHGERSGLYQPHLRAKLVFVRERLDQLRANGEALP